MLLPAEGLAFSASFKQTVTKNGTPILHMDVVMRDRDMKADIEMQGGQSTYLRNADGAFSILKAQGVAFRVPPEVESNSVTDELSRYMEFLKENRAVNTGTETIEGFECDVYWFTAQSSGFPTKAWVWKEAGFPIKIETDALDGVVVTHFYDIELDAVVDDETFRIPSGVEIAN